jgi:hypothetical protein
MAALQRLAGGGASQARPGRSAGARGSRLAQGESNTPHAPVQPRNASVFRPLAVSPRMRPAHRQQLSN